MKTNSIRAALSWAAIAAIMSAIMLIVAHGDPLPQIHSDGTLPDPVLTPGAIRTTDRVSICTTRTSEIRNVPNSLKETVRRRYGIANIHDKWCSGIAGCEIDHLVCLACGGSNDVTNLFVQTYDRSVKWNAHVKDQLENHVHKMICKDNADIELLQHEMATNWIEMYKKYIGPEPVAGRFHSIEPQAND